MTLKLLGSELPPPYFALHCVHPWCTVTSLPPSKLASWRGFWKRNSQGPLSPASFEVTVGREREDEGSSGRRAVGWSGQCELNPEFKAIQNISCSCLLHPFIPPPKIDLIYFFVKGQLSESCN